MQFEFDDPAATQKISPESTPAGLRRAWAAQKDHASIDGTNPHFEESEANAAAAGMSVVDYCAPCLLTEVIKSERFHSDKAESVS